MTLPEGVYTVFAGSTDNHGYREPDKLLNLKVDAAAPETHAVIEKTNGENGYTLTPVSITLTGSDSLSGLERIEIEVNGTESSYASPLQFAREGTWSFAYNGKDRAGNRDERKSFTFKLDFEKPTVTGWSTTEPGLGVVYLTAADSYSGVARIEYKTDGGATALYTEPVAIPAEGAHAVAYRALDNAGRSSEWQLLSLTVPAYTQAELVAELEIPGRESGREVVRNVAPGEVLYAGVAGYSRGKAAWKTENRIDALPEYLVGSDFIRVNVEDGLSSRDWELLHFSAREDCTVYLMVHKNSGAELAGWTLIEESFPVENEYYFEGGADVYAKAVRKGERVTVPAVEPARRKTAYPHLVFVAQPAEAAARITAPQAGTELTPERTVKLSGTNLAADPSVVRKWSLRYEAESEWTALPEGSSSLTLPYTAESSELILRLELYRVDGAYLGSDEESYLVINKAALALASPGPGTELEAGSTVPMVFRVTDITGEELPPESVSWLISADAVTWAVAPVTAPASPAEAPVLTVPAQEGEFFLKGVWAESGTRVRERVYRFTSEANPSPFTLAFGEESEGDEGSGGEVFGERESGKFYGFSSDHRERVQEFIVMRRPAYGYWGSIERESAVSLAAGEAFLVRSGNGRYRVTVQLGPVTERGSYELIANGSALDFTKRYSGAELYTVETEVTVTDGLLRITGTEDLPLVSMTLTPLSEDAPAGEPAVKVNDRLLVIQLPAKHSWSRPHGGPPRALNWKWSLGRVLHGLKEYWR